MPSPANRITLTLEEARDLLISASINSGAKREVAESISEASLDAEMEGSQVTGISHLLVYCDAMIDGRVDGNADPAIETPTPVIFSVDAKGGFPHVGFDRVLDDFCTASRQFGIALFSSRNGFTCGGLGYFARRLAERGLVALAATNAGPPMLAASGSAQPVFATNPLAFAFPSKGGAPLLIDQSSSQTTWTAIQQAADSGETIPQGWAIDSNGNPTESPAEALRGALLATGGARGANIALMVEMLAAGVTGANWSLDAPSFSEGGQCPGVGLFVVAIDPRLVCGDDSAVRVDDYLSRIESELGAYIPGQQRAKKTQRTREVGIQISEAIYSQLKKLSNTQ